VVFQKLKPDYVLPNLPNFGPNLDGVQFEVRNKQLPIITKSKTNSIL
jgi:hypothetical protein